MGTFYMIQLTLRNKTQQVHLRLCVAFISETNNWKLITEIILVSFKILNSTIKWFCVSAVALYAISAVYFAGVMVRLMLTLTPVVCMLSAIAFSNVFEHYLGDDMKRENPPVEDSSDEDDKRNPGNLYDKVGDGGHDGVYLGK